MVDPQQRQAPRQGDDRGRSRARYEHAPPTRYEPALTAGRVPPHDLDAEAAVLAAIMLSPGALNRVMDILKPEHFYSDANRKIFEAALALAAAKTPIDITTIASWLRKRETLKQIGGAAYLAQLADATPAVAHVAAHAEAVVDAARVRQAIAVCQKISAEGYGDVGVTQEYLDAAATVLGTIAKDQAITGAPKRLGDGLLAGITQDQKTVVAGGSLITNRTGWEKLDAKLAGLHDGDLLYLAARPGMGKSSLALLLALNVVAPDETEKTVAPPEADLCAAVFSLEMPLDQVQNRFVCMEARLDVGARRRGTFETTQWEAAYKAGVWLADLPIWIDDAPGLTPALLRARLRQIVAEWERVGPANKRPKKLGVVVIDYLQLMRFPGFTGEAEISEISRALKEIAKEFKVPVVALSQLNRAVETRDAKNKRPQLSDLRGSGSIEQDADTILFIYRDDYYNPQSSSKGLAEIIVAKQRNGSLGKVLLTWTGSCTRFDNLRPGEGVPDDEDPDQ